MSSDRDPLDPHWQFSRPRSTVEGLLRLLLCRGVYAEARANVYLNIEEDDKVDAAKLILENESVATQIGYAKGLHDGRLEALKACEIFCDKIDSDGGSAAKCRATISSMIGNMSRTWGYKP